MEQQLELEQPTKKKRKITTTANRTLFGTPILEELWTKILGKSGLDRPSIVNFSLASKETYVHCRIHKLIRLSVCLVVQPKYKTKIEIQLGKSKDKHSQNSRINIRDLNCSTITSINRNLPAEDKMICRIATTFSLTVIGEKKPLHIIIYPGIPYSVAPMIPCIYIKLHKEPKWFHNKIFACYLNTTTKLERKETITYRLYQPHYQDMDELLRTSKNAKYLDVHQQDTRITKKYVYDQQTTKMARTIDKIYQSAGVKHKIHSRKFILGGSSHITVVGSKKERHSTQLCFSIQLNCAIDYNQQHTGYPTTEHDDCL